MDFQVQRSANRGVGLLLLGGAAVVLCLGVGAGAVVATQSSFAEAAAVVGVLLVPTLVLVGLAVALLCWRALFPRTLRVRDGRVQLLHGSEVVGQIPLANVEGLKVLREAVQNYGGGAVGGLGAALAQQRIADGNGLAFHVGDPEDRDTFWPARLRERRFEFHLDTPWEMTYQAIHDTLVPLVPGKPAKAPPPFPAPGRDPSAAPGPPAGDNPFDFR
jgi:hypothetical protein